MRIHIKKLWLIGLCAVGLLTIMHIFSYTINRESVVLRRQENECIRSIVESLPRRLAHEPGDCYKLESTITDCLTQNRQDSGKKLSTVETKNLTLCPLTSPLLQGPINIHINREFDYIVQVTNKSRPLQNWPPTMEEIAVQYKYLEIGGSYAGPSDCVCRTTVAVVVPVRDREMHLRYFLFYIHQLLQRQQLCYVIIVAEQVDKETFNKGQLMNSAFVYANQLMNFDCFIFHDVDIIAEDDRISYTCKNDRVVHLAPYIDKYGYKMKYGLTVGAALAFTYKQFRAVNGYSNEFVGWGGEDDDMAERINQVELKVWRENQTFVKFKMIKHQRDKGNPVNPLRADRTSLARVRMQKDGLTSLNTTSVNVIKYITHTRLQLKTFQPRYVEEAKRRHEKVQGLYQQSSNFLESFDFSALAAKMSELYNLRLKDREATKGVKIT